MPQELQPGDGIDAPLEFPSHLTKHPGLTNRSNLKQSRSTMKTKAQYALDINNIAKIEGMGDIHDVGTIGGTISSYSVSSKSNNALSINFKNSLYKKVSGAEGGRQQHEPATSTFEEISQSMYFQSQLGHQPTQTHHTHRNDNKTKKSIFVGGKSRSRNRERGRRGITTIDAAEQDDQHVQ